MKTSVDKLVMLMVICDSMFAGSDLHRPYDLELLNRGEIEPVPTDFYVDRDFSKNKNSFAKQQKLSEAKQARKDQMRRGKR